MDPFYHPRLKDHEVAYAIKLRHTHDRIKSGILVMAGASTAFIGMLASLLVSVGTAVGGRMNGGGHIRPAQGGRGAGRSSDEEGGRDRHCRHFASR